MNNYTYLHPNSGYPVNCKVVDIYDLLEHKEAVLLPIAAGEKRPSISGWQALKFSETQEAEHLAMLQAAFNKAAIGVQLGNGIYAIDVDSDELADKFLEVNPRLQNTLRTRGARGCQFWIKIDGDSPSSSKLKLNGRDIGEWRSKGNQSVIYGQHPSGPRYQVLTQAKPVTIKFEEINWPDGWFGKFNEQPPKEDSNAKHERIEAYVAAVKPSVSGEGGCHNRTLSVASALTNGFELSFSEAMPYMEMYNGKCDPPWSPKQLEHKVSESLRISHQKPRGHLLTGSLFPDPETSQEITDREMVGGSILDFANAPVDTSATLLGERYLCRGGGAFFVAPSGQGKSSLACQLAVEWSIGGDPIGIKSAGPLRVLIIQGEDDQGDVTEMTRWVKNAGFSQEKLSTIGRNTHIETVDDVVGDKFMAVLDNFCGKWKPDVVIINPYTSFLGGDPKDDALANHFLREGLTPILRRHGCAAIIMHHTPKTQFNPSADFTTTDFMYRGAGCASMTNWSRAYLVFEPVNEEKLFRFVAAKRGQRIGWDSPIRFYRHSRVPGEIKWIPASKEEVDAGVAKKSKSVAVDPEKALECFPVTEPIPKDVAVLNVMSKLNIGRDKAREVISWLDNEGKIFPGQLFPETPSGKKGGRPRQVWSRSPMD